MGCGGRCESETWGVGRCESEINTYIHDTTLIGEVVLLEGMERYYDV